MKRTILALLLFSLFGLSGPTFFNISPAAAQHSGEEGWVEQKDPHGFTLHHPRAWHVQTTAAKQIMRTQQANDKIFQDMDNVINGETTLVDPETGKEIQAAAGANYYWHNGNTVVGTQTYRLPGVNFTPLKQAR